MRPLQGSAQRVVGVQREVGATTNDFVHITTRSQPRQDGRAPILRVGAQMESISPALLSADTKRMEVGLPILLGVPPNMRLTPGEYLNLFIETGRK